MLIEPYIALRYLFAKKSHNVINIISAISAIGMAVGTAALIIILSVYNGFDSLVSASLSDTDPDILVLPSRGKFFTPDSATFARVYENDKVYTMYGVLQERVFISYGGKQSIALAKGIDEEHELDTPLRTHISAGEFNLRKGEQDLCVAGAGLAHSMGLNPHFVEAPEFYYPVRDKRISLADPMSSIIHARAKVAGIVSVNADLDAQLVILPMRVMQRLLGVRDEFSGVEIRMRPGSSAKDTKALIKELEESLGGDFLVLDRYRQNEAVFKMMKYEKASTYLILIFVIIIIAFNIFGSLSMLIIEKKDDIGTFLALGATPGLLRRIFVLEGWLISLFGLAAGLVAGLLFAFLQQKFGLVSMPGNYMIDAYPVVIKGGDVLLTALGVGIVGYIVALLPVSGNKFEYDD